MPHPTVSPEIRAAALADLHGGEQPAIVAERYGIARGVVKTWKQRYVSKGASDSLAESDRPVPIRRPSIEQAQLDIAALVMENLRAKLTATQRIAEYAANSPAWLEKQTAADVGDLFEHFDRSAIAILDRMAGAGRPAPAPEGGDPDRADQS